MRTLLVLAALAGPAVGAVPGGPMPRYAAHCELLPDGSLSGYVTNEGPGSVQVAGIVKFVLWTPRTIGGEEVQAQANGVVAPGQTGVVVRARRVTPPPEDMRCYLDVGDAVREL